MKYTQRFRNIVFTLNNYNDYEYNDLLTNEYFKYIIIGKEVGDSGTPHLQGYGEFKKQLTLNQVKCINSRMHFEPRRGSQLEAITYCKKENDFVESGAQKIQGQRTDLMKIRNEICEGKSYREVLKENELSAGQLKVIDSYYNYLYPKEFINKNVIWIHGPTGTGKTQYAWNSDDLDNIYCKEPDDKWWDGYDGHNTIIIDELRGCHFKFSKLLRLLDRYPMRVETKGGFRHLSSKNIIITSNKSPIEMFNGKSDEDIQQLLRRINRVIDTRSQKLGNTTTSIEHLWQQYTK